MKLPKRGQYAERVEMVPTSPWWGEHRSRYHYAARYVRGKTVLDIACGSGFGSKIMEDAGAGYVVGADLSSPAVVETRGVIDGGVCISDGTCLGLADNAFDVIVSFETLEHVEKDEAFVAELRRILAPGGILILSTPNAIYTAPIDGKPQNPFHVREYEAGQLEALLRQSFEKVTIFGQRARPGYPLNPFWQRRANIPTDLRTKLALISWQVQHRLPFSIKDRLSRLLHNRPFYPGEYDWVFTATDIEESHVFVAECRL